MASSSDLSFILAGVVGQALSNTQDGRSCAGVCRDFVAAGPHCPLRHFSQSRSVPADADRSSGWADAIGALPFDELLYQPVLEGVKRDYGQAALRSEHFDGADER